MLSVIERSQLNIKQIEAILWTQLMTLIRKHSMFKEMTVIRKHSFQRTLIVEIRTLVVWLKSTLLLKIECQEKHIYKETECLQTPWNTASFRAKGKALRAKRKRVGVN